MAYFGGDCMQKPSFPPPIATVIPDLCRHSRILYRHSRVSGNPDGTEKTSPLPPNRRQIPPYAGMTVGRPGNPPENCPRKSLTYPARPCYPIHQTNDP